MRFLQHAGLTLFLCAAACAAVAGEPKPTSAYERETVGGFTILFSDEVRAHPEVLADVRSELTRQLGAIRRTLPRAPLEAVERVPIWVEWSAKERGGAEFHPSADWLREHGYNPEKAGSVEISNARNFVAWSRTEQPCMVLHELAHAYHFLVLGHRHAGVTAAYERAVAAGRYDAVRHVAGDTRPAYAKTNDKEYFAELSEAYFGINDFEPFDRVGLEMHDPDGFALLREVWGEPRSAAASVAVLCDTQPLAEQADLSAAMVAGIDSMASALIERSLASRQPTREKLAAVLGMVDERLPVRALVLVGDTTTPAVVAETDRCRVVRVRWPVFDGVHGEGLHVQPKGRPHARLVLLPDADTPPESLVDSRLLTAGCEVVIPALVNRGTECSRTDRLGIRTDVPHREWIHRQCYELGRHLVGYEVQKALAAVDWFEAQPERLPVIVAGAGEGGMLAVIAAALDARIDGVFSAGWFGPREDVWREPLDRNVFGLLRDFGGAEIASLVAPRPLVLQHAAYPEHTVSRAAPTGVRAIAAPGRLTAPDRAAFDAEVARARAIAPQSRIVAAAGPPQFDAAIRHLLPAESADRVLASLQANAPAPSIAVDSGRQERTVRELSRFSQRLLVACDAERAAGFWAGVSREPAAYEAHAARHRDRLWHEVIGRLPDPSLPVNPRSRLIRETEQVAIYEVVLDVWDGVFAWGWLCLPKDLATGERRPVVVCQHGLEGLPEDTVDTDPAGRAWGAYKAFALRLAERGFVTFAPHNPYRGGDAFRTLQRKLNPMGLSLFSVIIGQHQRILEWLQAQPFVQPDRIAFYGLSYGGKSAMRIPAVLTGYCLSICSGDFNEWVRYCVSTDLPIPGYMHAPEYEIWEWNLGRTFNYGELAALIAPRPFMVERGHDDGCGTDEMVNQEYAKVRRLYDKLGLGDRTTIEYFDGPHTIHGVGTVRFLEEHLGLR